MQGNPMDLFDEVDELFVRLFSRMDREFFDGIPQGYGYRFMFRDNEKGLEREEMADGADPIPRLTGEPVTAVLPPVDRASMHKTLKNGVLECGAGRDRPIRLFFPCLNSEKKL
jgi:hypothetical protein